MKPFETSTEKTFRQSLGEFKTIPPEEMESAGAQALKYLESHAGDYSAEKADAVIDQPSRVSWRFRWPAVAAIAAAITLAVFLPTRIAQSAPATLEDANGTRKIQYGEIVRPIGDKSATLSMSDGSRVEMQSQSEFSLERVEDGGTRIRLNRGAVTVVAAVTGEIRVQQGTTELKLRAGEQAASVPATTPKERIAFEEVSVRPAAPSAPPGPNARGGGGGGGGGAPCSASPPEGRIQLDPRRLYIRRATLWELVAFAIGPCGGMGGDVVTDRDARLTGGPAWVNSERWDVEALIPESSDPLPADPLKGYFGELAAGRSPKLQKMILTLVEERFKVVVRREMKELPAYAVTVGPNGTKFQSKDWVGYLQAVPTQPPGWKPPAGADPSLMPVRSTGRITGRIEAFDPVDVRVITAAMAQGVQGSSVWESGACLDDPGAIAWGNPGEFPAPNVRTSCTSFVFLNEPMSEALRRMQPYVRREVIDRTGIQGRVSFAVDWVKPPYVPGQFYAAKSLQEFSKALERVGLQVKEDKALVEYYVIERAEKPAGN
jgi:uncharacterized protein (TIGR03435 family)